MIAIVFLLSMGWPQFALAEEMACSTLLHTFDPQRTGLRIELVVKEKPLRFPFLHRPAPSAYIEVEYATSIPPYLAKRLQNHRLSVYHLPIAGDVDIEDIIVDPLVALLDLKDLFQGTRAPFRLANYRGQIIEVNADNTQLNLRTRFTLVTKEEPALAHQELLNALHTHLQTHLPHLYNSEDWSHVQNGYTIERSGKVLLRTPVGNFPLQLE